jgi:hypothetical protein
MHATRHDTTTQQVWQRGLGGRDGWQGDHRASASAARRGAMPGGQRLRLARGGVNDTLGLTTAKPTWDPPDSTARGTPRGDRAQRGQQVPMECVHEF